MKKAVSLLLALTMIFALCACGGDDLPAASPPTATAEPTQAPTATPSPIPAELVYPPDGTEPDYAAAVEMLAPMAEQGDVEAQYYLGYLYDYCLVGEDPALAAHWYEKAAEGGYVKALLALGQLYQSGEGVAEDEERAESLCKQAVDAGALELSDDELNGDGMFYIGRMYAISLGVEQDYAKAMEWLLKAADLGNASSMRLIGVLYENGDGVEQDYSKAMEWYLKSADNGNVRAMKNISLLYYDGKGVEQDFDKAVEWLIKAADTGDAEEMNNVGSLYAGHGMQYHNDEELAKAVKWFLKAADMGNADAMYNLSTAYNNGWGVEKDFAKGLEWCIKSAENGSINGMNGMGYTYEHGSYDGTIEPDAAKAAEWYAKAEEATNKAG